MIKITNMHMPLIAFTTLVVTAAACVGMALVLQGTGEALRAHAQTRVDTEAHRQVLADLERSLEETEGDRSYLSGLILQGEDDAVPFLSTIDEVSDGLGLELRTEKLELRERKGEPFDALAVTFSVKGSEDAVLRFFSLLETLPYHVRIEAGEFKRSQDELTGARIAQGRLTLLVTIDTE